MKKISNVIAHGLWKMADGIEWLGDKFYYPSADDLGGPFILETRESAEEFLRNN